MVKKGVKFLVLFFVIILLTSIFLAPIISAGFFNNFWGKITGKATSDTTSLNITVGNSAPKIPFVSQISAQDPTEDSTKSISFSFTASDTDGVANLDDNSAKAYFNKSGETTRYNSSCIWIEDLDANSANYSCTIDMWYFDENGIWTINVSIEDINSAYIENTSSSFTYNLLTSMAMSPTSLTWPAVGVSDTDIGATNDPIKINNTGNDNALTIDVTAYDLQGETTATEYIYAHNFTIGISSEGCSGTAMANASAETVGSAVLNKGNHSVNDGSTGQEQLYFCLKGLPQDISAQSYSSEGIGAWMVEIVT